MDSRSRYLREGIIAGLIAAAIVAVWFLIFDAARGQPFRTPALLGAAAMQGIRDPGAVMVTPGLVARYTVLHGAIFAMVGVLIAFLIATAQRQPSRLLVMFVALMCFEVAFLAVLTWWAHPVVTALRWWAILIANALAAGGMLVYFFVGYRSLGGMLFGPWTRIVREGLAELEALAQTATEAIFHTKILAYCELAHAYLDDGDLDRARQAFVTAEGLADSESFRFDGRSWISRAGVRLTLSTGRLGDARDFADAESDPFWAAVARARVSIADDDQATAAIALETAIPRCVRHEVVDGLLTARCTDDHDESLKFATGAVEQAAQAGILQTVASEGADILELVERAAWRVPSPWLERLRRTAASSSMHVRVPKLIDPLTERERDVLRFLPSRLTIREIADELFVSVNTLKFHLKVIYRKLGVSSRAEAAELARRMSHLS